MFTWPPTWSRLLLLPAIFVGFTVHELAHAVVAFLLGDTSQIGRKRLSFNPIRHVSVFGMMTFLIVGFGWAKPVWIDHSRLRTKEPALGIFLVSIAGAVANLLTAVAAFVGIVVTLNVVWASTGVPWNEVVQYVLSPQVGLDAHGLAVALSLNMVTVNLVLAFFNLLPIPPFDGFQAAVSLAALIKSAFKRGRTPVPRPGTAHAAGPQSALASPAEIHLQIAMQYHRDGQFDEAIARYRQAVAQDQTCAVAYYNLALVYWAKGRLDLATTMFKSAHQAGNDPAVRAQAGQRLVELAKSAEEHGSAPPSPPLEPLEPGAQGEAGMPKGAPLDPALARGLWLRLGIGAALFVLFAVGAWVYVTVVAYLALAPA